MRELVFVHGRAQEFKDAANLKAEWIDAFREGLHASGLELPIAESAIRFPYYGQTLHDLVEGVPEDQVARVILRGLEADAEKTQFANEFLRGVCERFGVTDRDLRELDDEGALERGVLNWKLARSLLRVIDRKVTGASALAVALFTNDVYEYLGNPGLQSVVDGGLRSAFQPGVETVVVSHSLGTVVAYNLLRREGKALGLRVPLHVTLGSPLAVKVIKRRLTPIAHPACVRSWFNAMDPDDVVALYPLTHETFGVMPEIENKTDVNNRTPNQHGISGYLSDPEVARRIHAALVAS